MLALAAVPLRADVGLFTSLPILWREETQVSDLLRPAPPHWAKAVIGQAGDIVPLDRLDSDDPRLAGLTMLVMAQPRPLAPAESVALDAWLRRGGRLLVFADPMLTEDSAFAPGDRRRPQDIVRLDALLRRWGLALRFDAHQPAGERTVAVDGAPLPVNLPGRLSATGGNRACRIAAQGLLAECRIGRGRLRILADSALLERGPGNGDEVRRRALAGQLRWLVGAPGKSGKNREGSRR